MITNKEIKQLLIDLREEQTAIQKSIRDLEQVTYGSNVPIADAQRYETIRDTKIKLKRITTFTSLDGCIHQLDDSDPTYLDLEEYQPVNILGQPYKLGEDGSKVDLNDGTHRNVLDRGVVEDDVLLEETVSVDIPTLMTDLSDIATLDAKEQAEALADTMDKAKDSIRDVKVKLFIAKKKLDKKANPSKETSL